LYLEPTAVSSQLADQFLAQVCRRSQGAPLQHLLGEADFFGRAFWVNPDTFIPRPETEAVLAAALPHIQRLALTTGRRLQALDVGTGSGCLAVTLACEVPTCVVTAVEVSWSTLQTARRNALRHGVGGRVLFLQGSWLQAVSGPVDVLMSNPPYVATAEIAALPREVRQEPWASLDGGPDGLTPYRHLFHHAPRVLRPGGLCVIECGEAQVAALTHALRRQPWVEALEAIHDLAGRPRGLMMGCAGSAHTEHERHTRH
jgi:release factor glutamine methyltransferase